MTWQDDEAQKNLLQQRDKTANYLENQFQQIREAKFSGITRSSQKDDEMPWVLQVLQLQQPCPKAHQAFWKDHQEKMKKRYLYN